MRVALLLLALLLASSPNSTHGASAQTEAPDVRPKVLTKVLPAYMLSGKRLNGPEGVIKVEAAVNAYGAVLSAAAKGQSPINKGTINDTVKAFRLWRFEPGRKNGAPVPASVTLVVTFTKKPSTVKGKPGPLRLQATLSLEGAHDDFDLGTVSSEDPDATLPREKLFVAPRYPPGAMQRHVSGIVHIEAVVMPDGTVGRVRIVGTLDPELDEVALGAVRQWTFEPARKGGQAVSMVVKLEVEFKM